MDWRQTIEDLKGVDLNNLAASPYSVKVVGVGVSCVLLLLAGYWFFIRGSGCSGGAGGSFMSAAMLYQCVGISASDSVIFVSGMRDRSFARWSRAFCRARESAAGKTPSLVLPVFDSPGPNPPADSW